MLYRAGSPKNVSCFQGVYMDKNLAPGSAEGGSTARSSTHSTEETQNHQAPQGSASDPNNQLCHDVLTGKVLGPAPVSIPDGDTTVKFSAAGNTVKQTRGPRKICLSRILSGGCHHVFMFICI